MTLNTKILGIDPGSIFTGFSLIELNESKEIVRVEAWSLNIPKLFFYENQLEDSHTSRFARFIALRRYFKALLDSEKPQQVVSESPFYNPSRPGSYGVLKELTMTLELTLYDHNSQMAISYISPSEVKNAVNAKGGAGKDVVLSTIKQIDELKIVPFDLLSEHAVDATAVAYSFVLGLRK